MKEHWNSISLLSSNWSMFNRCPLKGKYINDNENETIKGEETGGRLPVLELRELGGQVNTGHRRTEIVTLTISTATNSMHYPIFIS